jgi:hypothetical protein
MQSNLMVNPGSFFGSHKDFLLTEKPTYAQAVTGGHTHDGITDIQWPYFKCFPVDYPHDQEPTPEMVAGVDNNTPESEYVVPDPEVMGEDEYETAQKTFQERCKAVAFWKEVCRVARFVPCCLLTHLFSKFDAGYVISIQRITLARHLSWKGYSIHIQFFLPNSLAKLPTNLGS